MARRFFLILGVLALASCLLPPLGSPMHAQSDCIGRCLSQYVNCSNGSGGSGNCDEQYDSCTERCIGYPPIITAPSAGGDGCCVKLGPVTSPALIDDLLQAHGGREAIALIGSYRINMAKIVHTLPQQFFVERVRLFVEGNQIHREISFLGGDRALIETINEGGEFEAVILDRDETGSLRSVLLPADAQRQSVVRANVSSCSLLPFLKRLSEPDTHMLYLGREADGSDRFIVSTPSGDYMVYADQDRRLRRVQAGEVTFEFADFRRVGPLLLPFTERVQVGNQLVYQFVFSEYVINPTR